MAAGVICLRTRCGREHFQRQRHRTLNFSAMLVGLAFGFTVVGAVAVWRAGQHGALAFFSMFERLQVLQ